jgi:L-Lysine epsilon oxidase N-terminal/L-lysine epsilon oxidase C-terminal domain
MAYLPRYSIHPGIGIARVGNSPSEFYLAPESVGSLPIECDAQGNTVIADSREKAISRFKDSEGRIKRQAARFQVYVYDEVSPDGRPLKKGDMIYGPGTSGSLVDISWSAYLANKKAAWYEFKELEGEHGYALNHPLRNGQITDSDARRQLIIDPGPQTINCTTHRAAAFALGQNPKQAQTFPPPLTPNSIETLGQIMTDDEWRLILLGGYGNSGSFMTSFGQPRISTFANNDGWFDDVSDGPLSAILVYYDQRDTANHVLQVHDSAWALVGNPGYAPQIVNMITMDDVLYDLSIQNFAFDTLIFGTTPFRSRHAIDPANPDALRLWRAAKKWWNPDYYVYFWRDIWPILTRPYYAQYVTDFLGISHDAHEIEAGGDFEETKISLPPTNGQDPYKGMRQYVYEALRKPGHVNQLLNTSDPNSKIYLRELMPLLCGDNPLTNALPSKFLRLTDTQLFLLRQWAGGRFINEKMEAIETLPAATPSGAALDHGVLGNILGGSFCPGGEVGWIIRNPAIYSKPYRINWNPAFLPTSGSGSARYGTTEFYPPELSQSDNFDAGLEPGDLTKRGALPWQADFNECTTQPVDVTYEEWNQLYETNNDPQLQEKNRKIQITLWWPTHRPMQVYLPSGSQVEWARGIPQTPAGDLKMVTAWTSLGFVKKSDDPNQQPFIEVEAADQETKKDG